MRYWIGFVVAVALMAAPLTVSAQEAGKGRSPESVQSEPAREAPGTSGSWLERMHPEALEGSPETSKSRVAIEYVPAQSPQPVEEKPKRSKGARIAMGVVIPLVSVGAMVGIAFAAKASQEIATFSW